MLDFFILTSLLKMLKTNEVKEIKHKSVQRQERIDGELTEIDFDHLLVNENTCIISLRLF